MGCPHFIRWSPLVAIALLLTGSAASHAAKPGIYEVWGASRDVASRPYVQGGQIVLQWSNVEPSRGHFNWSSLYTQLDAYRAMGKTATVQVNSTNGKPGWIWNVVARCGSVNGQAVPQYWNPAYLTLQSELVNGLAAAIRAYSHPETVALVRASPNAIGTELTMLPHSASCTAAAPAVTVGGGWSPSVAHTYFRNVMGLYDAAMTPDIHVALRAEAFISDGAPLSWLGPNGAWIMGTASDIDYNPSRDAFDVYARRWDRAGRTVSYWEPISYRGKHNLVSWNYWRILLELYKGVSYIAVYGEQIRHGGNSQYRAAFDFANRYAGSAATPQTSPGAFIALRKGRGRTAGNLGQFMTQYAPGLTSRALSSGQGRHMIGPARQRFGRYARRIAGHTSRSWMGFRLNNDFVAGVSGRKVVIGVWYLNGGHGSFRVSWGRSASERHVVHKTGTGRWKHFTTTIDGSLLRGRLAHGCDISLKALGHSRTAFHMVEVRVPGR